ncbi:MAG: hypothetical protein ACM35H_14010 [Bacteroidota bacterium]
MTTGHRSTGKNQPKVAMSRRRLLGTLGLGAGAAAVAAAAPTSASARVAEPAGKATEGYRETAHIRAYYQSAARF